MGLSRGEKGVIAAVLAALAVMLAVFGLRAVPAAPLDAIAPAAATPAAGGTIGGDLLNINTATVEELTALPGIGEAKAQAIVDYRAEHGPFRYPEELLNVKGIGEGILEGLLDYVTTGG